MPLTKMMVIFLNPFPHYGHGKMLIMSLFIPKILILFHGNFSSQKEITMNGGIDGVMDGICGGGRINIIGIKKIEIYIHFSISYNK